MTAASGATEADTERRPRYLSARGAERPRTFGHAGVRLATGPRGLPPDAVERLRKMLAFLQGMETEQEVHAHEPS